MPDWSYSSFSQPAPMPSSKRPLERTSIEPADMASTTGCRKSLSKTKPERRSRSVAMAAAAIAATGSNPRTKWSGQLIES